MTTGRMAYLQNMVSTEAPCTSIQTRAEELAASKFTTTYSFYRRRQTALTYSINILQPIDF